MKTILQCLLNYFAMNIVNQLYFEIYRSQTGSRLLIFRDQDVDYLVTYTPEALRTGSQ